MNYEITHKSPKGGFYMKITFIGATHEVTGSCYYLEAAGHKFLVDCGMEQGPDYYNNHEYTKSKSFDGRENRLQPGGLLG